MSPLLFNLIADALSEILNTAKEKGLLTGLLPKIVEGGLTHLQYADDTYLFKTLSKISSISNSYCFVMRRYLE